MNMHANLIIFGQAGGIKNFAALGGKPIEYFARESGTDAIRRHERIGILPRAHVDGLKFGKLIDINAVRNFGQRGGDGQHRHLHHRIGLALAIYQ